MTAPRNSSPLLEKCFYLTFLIVLVTATKECDETLCPGPLKYYKDLGCQAVYEKPGDCCAVEYNCDHIKSREKNKCYVNGHTYNIGESLRDEDSNPCDIGCTCTEGDDGIASFTCAEIDCYFGSYNDTCYMRQRAEQCCPGPEVCLKEGEKRPTCEVDGKIYQDGEYFKPQSDPELNCYCGPDYKGENVEPFCRKPYRPYCAPDFRGAGQVYSNCAPVYYHNQSPQTDCSVFSRCQNADDSVIPNSEDTKSTSETEVDRKCKFGNMTMNLRDKLSIPNDNYANCVICLCEVPPTPTCVRLSQEQCSAIGKSDDYSLPEILDPLFRRRE